MIELPRATIARAVRIDGAGLHSGEPVEVNLEPSSGGGIIFEARGQRVRAIASNVDSTIRCTALSNISTIEHLMAAFAGFGITDCLVRVEGRELPALDGSAAGWLDVLDEIGATELEVGHAPEPPGVSVKDGSATIRITAGAGNWTYRFFSGDRWPGEQELAWRFSRCSFISEVAPARTFAFEEEIEGLRLAGLGQGLSDESTLILGPEGYVNEPRFPDEPVRHKMLDLIGDLYLAGYPPLLLDVEAVRSGHSLNVRAATALQWM